MRNSGKKGTVYDGCYGAKHNADMISQWILSIVKDNAERTHNRITVNCWGNAGLGKTSIVKQMSNFKINFRGVEMPIKVIDIPLAQIEEMGDILGMPDSYVEMKRGDVTTWVIKEDAVIASFIKDGWSPTMSRPQTHYSPPAWAPREECPGIILFDDGNRASSRIMKGLMQLVQDYRTIGWELPAGWTIVFTGNPDTSQYQITQQDTAMITRMKHITMVPDVKSWAKWATAEGIDPRGISFLIKYPEILNPEGRTNFRTLTEFFRCLKKYGKNISTSDREMLAIDGYSLLDDATVTTFFTFMDRDMELVIEPEEILKDADKAIKHINELLNRKEARTDIVYVMCERLCAYLLTSTRSFEKKEIENFQKFIICDGVPKENAQGIMRRMVQSESNVSRLVPFVTGNEQIRAMVRSFTVNADIVSKLN